jgi:hypothetical protein
MGDTSKKQKAVPSDRLVAAMRKEARALLRGGYAHAKFDKAVSQFPHQLRGVIPEGLPYSAWQILEHMRITQQYMLNYSKHDLLGEPWGQPKKLNWPRDYWVKSKGPTGDKEWSETVAAILHDREEFARLFDGATDDTLIKISSPRTRKTIWRLALQMADHNAYHLGQLIIIRRLLGAWKR